MTALRRGQAPVQRPGSGRVPAVNRSVTRALSILELLSRSEGAVALGEVATRLKLPKSSALTLLRALVAGEFCVTDDHGHYALGVHTFEVGAGYLRSMTPVRSVSPELEWLTEVLGVTSHFAVLERDEVIYLAKHDPPGLGLKLASSLGARLPAAVTAVGKAQLAYRKCGPTELDGELKWYAALATPSTMGRPPSGSGASPLLCSTTEAVVALSGSATCLVEAPQRLPWPKRSSKQQRGLGPPRTGRMGWLEFGPS